MKGHISRLHMRSLPMLPAGSEPRREVIRKKLAQGAESADDANMIAAATVAVWLEISARLAPVIGTRGVDVLFSRTLHLAKRSFSWLGVPADRERDAVSVDDIRARLGRQEASAAAAASCEFLFIFTVLLATLIGDSLTDRLLGPVWAQALPPPPERERGL
jgi:hypothetical protein